MIVTLTSLTINKTEYAEIEPKLPLTPIIGGTTEIVVPYKWTLETYYGVDITYEAGRLRGGHGASTDTWTKPVVNMPFIVENESIHVGEKAQFSTSISFSKCPFGPNRSLKPIGLATCLVDLQSPSGITKRIDDIFRDWNINGFGSDMRKAWNYVFDEAGEWSLKFQLTSSNYPNLATSTLKVSVLKYASYEVVS
jgi:hypothetical protein